MIATEPQAPARRERTYNAVFAGLDAPFAFVDLDAMWWNAESMLRRAGRLPIRVASKSLRCREILSRILARDARLRGVMSFTLPEALWLHGHGVADILVAYPTVGRAALADLARLDSPDRPVVMVDSAEHLDLIDAAGARREVPVRVCIDLDVSWRTLGGRVAVGPKRSPLRQATDVVALAEEIARRPGIELRGLMGYEGHVAGVGDKPPGQRLKGMALHRLQPLWMTQAAAIRRQAVEAIRAIAPLQFVNAGGTGSLQLSARESWVTEVTAGSGFYAPTLFDTYSSFRLRPAAMFALPVVRRPGPGVVTVLGGGYIASGAAAADRMPSPHLPAGLRLDSLEGAGEVQTPLLGSAADSLRIGDNVYFRHAKAGELCERFNELHLVEGGEIVATVPTYRGEGQAFL